MQKVTDRLAFFDITVAPRTGAWIETQDRSKEQMLLLLSHPARVRGLKLVVI